jgi:pre-60S factor REI1
MSDDQQQAACQACRVSFPSAESQRDHYRGEFHRFNLKRKLVRMLPLSEDQFNAHVEKEAQDQSARQATQQALQCRVCRGKRFATRATFDHHVRSKQHLKNAAKAEARAQAEAPTEPSTEAQVESVGAEDAAGDDTPEAGPSSLASSAGSRSTAEDSATPIEIERRTRTSDEAAPEGADLADLDDEEEIERMIAERLRTAKRLPVEACLFCPHVAEDTGDNFEHMAEDHSFFVPDIEHLDDAEGLLKYLGEKIAIGYECLECNGRGKAFGSLEAVRDHMNEKCHTKLDWFGNEVEYADFYEWPEAESPFKDMEPGIKLILANGKELGHRDLDRYYKQNYRAEEDREAIIAAKAQEHAMPASQRNAKLQMHLAGRYKALGWGQGSSQALTNVSPAVRREMTSRFMRATKRENRWRNDQRMKIGMNNSNLPKHIRDPNMCLW